MTSDDLSEKIKDLVAVVLADVAEQDARRLANLIESRARYSRSAWIKAHTELGLVLRHLGQTTDQASEICDRILKPLWED